MTVIMFSFFAFLSHYIAVVFLQIMRSTYMVLFLGPFNRVFSHDVTAAILVSPNNEMAAMLMSQTSPMGVELFSYANAVFCSNKFA